MVCRFLSKRKENRAISNNLTKGGDMFETKQPTAMLLPSHALLYQYLMTLVKEKRYVFFAGLPGTGKSLWIHQLTHLAVAAGRSVHLLQWDVARPVFEGHPAAQPYPVMHGVTHGVIRLAVGRWARRALVDWHQHHAAPEAMLIGETPCIGHRLIELARSADDAAEALLRQAACMFVIPVPAPQVREYIVQERRRRATAPVHEQERDDAPPHVLQALWEELVRLAPSLGVTLQATGGQVPYDPEVYQGVYRALLKHRQVDVLWCDALLPTTTFSVYDFASERHMVTPSAEEVLQYIQEVERDYPEAQALQREIARWYRV
jgi:hypothetical protein